MLLSVAVLNSLLGFERILGEGLQEPRCSWLSSGITAEQKAWCRMACRAEPRSEAKQARHRVASAVAPSALWRDKLRRYAASFAFIHERRMVDRNVASWNPLISWLRRIEVLRQAA